MDEKYLKSLVRKTARASAIHCDLVIKLGGLLRERYGTHPSDVDCDCVIDALDYGQDPKCTLKYIDEAMTACGHPPLSNNPEEAQP